MRETFGDRQIYAIAQDPIRAVVAKVPLPFVTGIYQGARDRLGKMLDVPPLPTYKLRMPLSPEAKRAIAGASLGSAVLGGGLGAVTVSHLKDKK